MERFTNILILNRISPRRLNCRVFFTHLFGDRSLHISVIVFSSVRTDIYIILEMTGKKNKVVANPPTLLVVAHITHCVIPLAAKLLILGDIWRPTAVILNHFRYRRAYDPFPVLYVPPPIPRRRWNPHRSRR